MSTEEIVILDYLQLFPDTFVSPVQVCKRAAGRKKFALDPEWARIYLRRLEEQSRIESNQFGHYKLIDKGGNAKKARQARCYKAITTYVLEMESGDDDTPFVSILREAIQIAYDDSLPEDKKQLGDSSGASKST